MLRAGQGERRSVCVGALYAPIGVDHPLMSSDDDHPVFVDEIAVRNKALALGNNTLNTRLTIAVMVDDDGGGGWARGRVTKALFVVDGTPLRKVNFKTLSLI